MDKQFGSKSDGGMKWLQPCNFERKCPPISSVRRW